MPRSDRDTVEVDTPAWSATSKIVAAAAWRRRRRANEPPPVIDGTGHGCKRFRPRVPAPAHLVTVAVDHGSENAASPLGLQANSWHSHEVLV
jgi:hypothetical protein